ncbi:MAG TPA: 3'-5' exonuclease [Salinivirgaceae bacterium]|nr:3'-5' exonuclease [Salinivirgaceae bacterium]
MNDIQLNNILFLDIETVPCVPDYNHLDSKGKALWDKKAAQIAKSADEDPETLFAKAGIYSEFGKIICISCGIIVKEGNNLTLRIKSFYNDSEKELLTDFSEMLNRSFNDDSKYLCAHNGKEFDFPYIARRMLINGLKIPTILNIAGKKPWEVRHFDTMELWKFGDYKHYTSLDLLTYVFKIPTPKDDIDGSQVHSVYWSEGDLPRIVKYCQKDVVAIVNLFLKYRSEEIIEKNQIILT